MARIRTIKPEFFRHAELFDAEKESGFPLRVAFAGLWCVADKAGRFKWRPRELKLDILPYDEIDMADVMDSLAKHGFVLRYDVDGNEYGCIPSWEKHQFPNTRESESKIPCISDASACVHVHAYEGYSPRGINIPKPLREYIFNRDGRKCLRCGKTTDLTVDHIFPRSIGGTHSENNLRTLCRECNSARPVAGKALEEDLARDGLTMADMQRTCMHVQDNGELERELEGKGEEREEYNVGLAPDPAPKVPKPDPPFQDIIDYLNAKAGRKFRVSDEAKKIIRARWKSGATLDDFRAIVDHRAQKWGKNPDMAEYLRPSTLFAPKHFDEYLAEAMAWKHGATKPDDGPEKTCEACGLNFRARSSICPKCGAPWSPRRTDETA